MFKKSQLIATDYHGDQWTAGYLILCGSQSYIDLYDFYRELQKAGYEEQSKIVLEEFQIETQYVISEGTLNKKDLFFTYSNFLGYLKNNIDFLNEKELEEEVEKLEKYLESMTGEGVRFGSHPDDPALIGFWVENEY